MLSIQNLIDDEKCFEMVRELRWPERVSCPHCQSTWVNKRGFHNTQQYRQRYLCLQCNPQFDDLTKTVFEGHHQPLKVWVICLYFMGLNLSNRQIAAESEETYSQLHRLRQGAGKVSVKTILGELEKLETLARLQLPEGLFVGVPATVLKSYRTRMIAEELHEIRRHPDAVRYTLLAAYCWERRREVTDTVVDLLLLLVHQLTFRAERNVDRELLNELKRVKNKGKLLYDIAGAALEKPDGTIETVIHPVADEGRLQDVVDEYEQTGGYIERVQVKMRSSCSRHTRKMIRPLLTQMTFCANNPAYQPMIDAANVIKRYVESKKVLYPETETVPLDGVVPEE